jgi:hypothetical protein
MPNVKGGPLWHVSSGSLMSCVKWLPYAMCKVDDMCQIASLCQGSSGPLWHVSSRSLVLCVKLHLCAICQLTPLCRVFDNLELVEFLLEKSNACVSMQCQVYSAISEQISAG